MKIIPSFKPAISYQELNKVLLRILLGNVSKQEIAQFEIRFAQYLGVKHAVGVPSGRWALYYILQSLSLKKGDEIILPAFTYFAVPAAIVKLGLKPVFINVNYQNLNIDVRQIEENITDRTRVIIPTHLCGFVCDLDAILDIAHKRNIFVIEDCAQSFGSEYRGRKVGSFGDASYFTFGITKNFTTLGGGMIATNDDGLADRIRQKVMTIHQMSNKVLFFKLLKAYIMKFATSPILFPAVYWIIRMFSYFNIDIVDVIFQEGETLLGDLPRSGLLNNIQAELGLLQLNSLDRNNELRMKKGLELYKKFEDVDEIQVPILEKNAKNIFSTCPILTKNKKDIKRILLRKGIDTSSGYMQDCSRLAVFKEFRKNCPNALRAENKILYFPIYPELTNAELIYMANTINNL